MKRFGAILLLLSLAGLLLLGILSVAVRGQTTQPSTQPTAPAPDLLVNLDGNDQAGKLGAFADLRHALNRWQVPTGINSARDAQTDADGYPLEEADSVCGTACYPTGTYHVSYRGTAKLEFFGGTAGAPQVVNGLTSFDVALRSGPPGFRIHASQLSPADPLCDLHIAVPGESPLDGLFREQFVRLCRPFAGGRMMDWGQTNGCLLQHWSDRPTLQTFAWTVRGKGVPVEAWCELANAAGWKVLWVCVPHGADDAFVRQFARTLRAHLSPGVTLYVEYSNEVWNNRFPQFIYNFQLAGADAGTQGKIDIRNGVWTFDPLHGVDGNTRAARRIAARLVQIVKIFRDEFGAEAARVRPILAGQCGNASWLENECQWLKLKYPVFLPDVTLAVAPYVYPRIEPPVSLDAEFADLSASLRDPAKGLLGQIRANVAVAHRCGLPIITYEAGQDAKGYFPAMQTDPRMGQLYADLLATWRGEGGGTFTHLSLCGPYWGLVESSDKDLSASFKAQGLFGTFRMSAPPATQPLPATRPAFAPDTQPAPAPAPATRKAA